MAWASVGVAAIGAWGAVESSKNKASGSGGGMPGMSTATDARSVESIFDNSGWNVSFGNSKIDSEAQKSLSQAGASVPNSPSLGATNIGQPGQFGYGGGFAGIDNQTLIYGALGLALLMAWKNKKSQ